jgi:hypothetical protein
MVKCVALTIQKKNSWKDYIHNLFLNDKLEKGKGCIPNNERLK